MLKTELGRLKGVYGVSPAFLQRASAVACLSFGFFLLMMAGFYWRQNIGYFLLATAFLAVNILTLIGWIAIRRKTVQIYEHGFRFKGFSARWDEISVVENVGSALKVVKNDGRSIELPNAIDRLEAIAAVIRSNIDKS
ncbi:MAG: hypothetical protein IPJ30_14820 [Acidobacteria bacterium]|nr:hypothetical protein [Acidobacteriota bacterium]